MSTVSGRSGASRSRTWALRSAALFAASFLVKWAALLLAYTLADAVTLGETTWLRALITLLIAVVVLVGLIGPPILLLCALAAGLRAALGPMRAATNP